MGKPLKRRIWHCGSNLKKKKNRQGRLGVITWKKKGQKGEGNALAESLRTRGGGRKKKKIAEVDKGRK